MPTSGITISELTRDDIITRALRKIGVIGEGQVPSATQLSEAADALGPLIQELATLGMPLWKRIDYPITLQTGVSVYNIGIGQTLNVPFPVKIAEATLEVNNSGSQIDVEIKPSYDFNLLPTNASGVVVNMKYQPFINYGQISVWPTPDANTQVLTLTYFRPFDVFSAGTDTADFPQEWQNALIYQLALILADDYGLPIPDKQWLEKQADKRLASALFNGTEEGSITFYPNREG
jgi:hypothetical protein